MYHSGFILFLVFLSISDYSYWFFLQDIKNAFEVVERDQPKALFTCKNEMEKNDWMAMLMTLHMRR